MSNKENARSFNYDVEALIGFNDVLTGNIQMTISGMDPAGDWNGLNNGVHALYVDGETADANTHSINIGSESSSYDYLVMRCYDQTSDSSFCYLNYVTHSSAYYRHSANYSSREVTSIASIGDRLFTNATLNGVDFTWAKGSEWERGSM